MEREWACQRIQRALHQGHWCALKMNRGTKARCAFYIPLDGAILLFNAVVLPKNQDIKHCAIVFFTKVDVCMGDVLTRFTGRRLLLSRSYAQTCCFGATFQQVGRIFPRRYDQLQNACVSIVSYICFTQLRRTLNDLKTSD